MAAGIAEQKLYICVDPSITVDICIRMQVAVVVQGCFSLYSMVAVYTPDNSV